MTKNHLNLLITSLLLIPPLFVRAQMGFNTPTGVSPKQDVEMYSRNNFLVQQKYRITTDPISGTYTTSCPGGSSSLTETAGVLLDPGGSGNYAPNSTCAQSFYDDTESFGIGYEITFETLNTEANGDSVIIEDLYGGRIAFSGTVLPPVLLVPGYAMTIRFKSDNDGTVGTGFRLRWRKVYFDFGSFGGTLHYDLTKSSLVSGLHGVGVVQRAGVGATITGIENEAPGYVAIAMGAGNSARGRFSTTLGYGNNAVNRNDVAIGESNTASGYGSVAIGSENLSSGAEGITIGQSNTANGPGAVAIGDRNVANGNHSFAIGGSMSNNGFQGAFSIGDYSTAAKTLSTAANQFTTRFAGGYRLFSNSASNIGVQLPAGGNAWSAISDSTKKERFLPLNHTDLLTKLRTLRLGTWNYKGQRTERHYGPMAQDFFARFGHDALGVIGCDTLLNSHDFTAVTLSGVQALALENEQLKARIAQLEQERMRSDARFEALERRVFIRPAPRATAITRLKQTR